MHHSSRNSFQSIRIPALVASNKAVVALDGLTMALQNITRFMISSKLIVSCEATRLIRSCWRFTKNGVKRINHQTNPLLTLNVQRSANLATIFERVRSAIVGTKWRHCKHASCCVAFERTRFSVALGNMHYNYSETWIVVTSCNA